MPPVNFHFELDVAINDQVDDDIDGYDFYNITSYNVMLYFC